MENTGEVLTIGTPINIQSNVADTTLSDTFENVSEAGREVAAFAPEIDVYSSDYIDAERYNPTEITNNSTSPTLDVDESDESPIDELDYVREELKKESEREIVVNEKEPTLEDKIRLIDETIAFLKAELEDLKKIRGSQFFRAMKNIIMFFIKDTFFEKPQNLIESPEETLLDAKIEKLELDIARLTAARERLIEQSGGGSLEITYA